MKQKPKMKRVEESGGGDSGKGRLTKACTGAREGSFIMMASSPRAPGDARR